MGSIDEIVIKTENLTKDFGDLRAVDHLNLAIARGEIFGLVGPDGAGKTTTLRMLAAIMNPTEGLAVVGGHDTVKQGDLIKNHIGYMAQGFALYGDLSVVENLGFFASVYQVRGEGEEPSDLPSAAICRAFGISRPPR